MNIAAMRVRVTFQKNIGKKPIIMLSSFLSAIFSLEKGGRPSDECCTAE